MNSIDYSNEENEEKQLVEILQIEGTPFHAVRERKIWHVTCGTYRLSEPLGSKEECEEEAKSITWFKIMNVIALMIENYKKDEEYIKKITDGTEG